MKKLSWFIFGMYFLAASMPTVGQELKGSPLHWSMYHLSHRKGHTHDGTTGELRFRPYSNLEAKGMDYSSNPTWRSLQKQMNESDRDFGWARFTAMRLNERADWAARRTAFQLDQILFYAIKHEGRLSLNDLREVESASGNYFNKSVQVPAVENGSSWGGLILEGASATHPLVAGTIVAGKAAAKLSAPTANDVRNARNRNASQIENILDRTEMNLRHLKILAETHPETFGVFLKEFTELNNDPVNQPGTFLKRDSELMILHPEYGRRMEKAGRKPDGNIDEGILLESTRESSANATKVIELLAKMEDANERAQLEENLRETEAVLQIASSLSMLIRSEDTQKVVSAYVQMGQFAISTAKTFVAIKAGASVLAGAASIVTGGVGLIGMLSSLFSPSKDEQILEEVRQMRSEMRAQFELLGQALNTIHQSMHQRFDMVDQRLNEIMMLMIDSFALVFSQNEALVKKLDRINLRCEDIQNQLSRMESRVDLFQKDLWSILSNDRYQYAINAARIQSGFKIEESEYVRAVNALMDIGSGNFSRAPSLHGLDRLKNFTESSLLEALISRAGDKPRPILEDNIRLILAIFEKGLIEGLPKIERQDDGFHNGNLVHLAYWRLAVENLLDLFSQYPVYAERTYQQGLVIKNLYCAGFQAEQQIQGLRVKEVLEGLQNALEKSSSDVVIALEQAEMEYKKNQKIEVVDLWSSEIPSTFDPVYQLPMTYKVKESLRDPEPGSREVERTMSKPQSIRIPKELAYAEYLKPGQLSFSMSGWGYTSEKITDVTPEKKNGIQFNGVDKQHVGAIFFSLDIKWKDKLIKTCTVSSGRHHYATQRVPKNGRPSWWVEIRDNKTSLDTEWGIIVPEISQHCNDMDPSTYADQSKEAKEIITEQVARLRASWAQTLVKNLNEMLDDPLVLKRKFLAWRGLIELTRQTLQIAYPEKSTDDFFWQKFAGKTRFPNEEEFKSWISDWANRPEVPASKMFAQKSVLSLDLDTQRKFWNQLLESKSTYSDPFVRPTLEILETHWNPELGNLVCQ